MYNRVWAVLVVEASAVRGWAARVVVAVGVPDVVVEMADAAGAWGQGLDRIPWRVKAMGLRVRIRPITCDV